MRMTFFKNVERIVSNVNNNVNHCDDMNKDSGTQSHNGAGNHFIVIGGKTAKAQRHLQGYKSAKFIFAK